MKSLESLTPSQAFHEVVKIQEQVDSSEKYELVYSCPDSSDFKSFSETKLLIPILNFIDFELFQVIPNITTLFIYEANIYKSALVDGYIIEAYSDGSYRCVVKDEELNTLSLPEAEKFLYEKFILPHRGTSE